MSITVIHDLLWYLDRRYDQTSWLCSSCRHWPKFHKLREDGGLGRMRDINRNRVAMTLARERTLVWYARRINRFKPRLVGPFNFESIAGLPG
eukprot:scaffold72471_cov70-Attheya_sp.AAC.1